MLLFLAWGIILVIFLNAGIGFWALKKIEKKAGTPIRGVFLPHLLAPAFTIQNPSLTWQDRFQLLSGHLHVQYDPLSLLPGRELRIQVRGTGLKVRLLGKWSEREGLGDMQVEQVEGDFAFSEKGPPEIFLFNVQSPELNFNLLQKNGNPR